MNKTEIKEGFLVRHPAKPEWGLGKVLALQGDNATIFFRDDATDHRTILLSLVELIVADEQSDPMLDKLPPFVDGAFVTKTKKVTIQDGIEKLKKEYPSGFVDSQYLGETTGERNYKLRAHKRYLDAFGDGKGEALLAAGDLEALRKLAQSVTTKDQMNLLSIYEAMALREGLNASDEAATEYFRALFAFVEGGPSQQPFNSLSSAVANLPSEQGRARVATWPVLTLLPFLADPTRFMFLKPEPTRACADRLRFDLLYDPALRWSTYERLMTMGEILLEELKPLGARDFIDVQSFMWVIQKY